MRKMLIACCLLALVPKIALAKIVFSSNREGNYEIYVMSDNGNNLKRLTYNLVRDYQPRWSPDGKQIAFVRRLQNQGDLFLMNADGRNERQLTHHPESDGPNLTWAPDGKLIAFGAIRDKDAQIHVIDITSGEVRRLTNDADGLPVDPAWSPDGKQIAYRYEDPEVGKSIYTMSTTGRRQKPLIPPKNGPILRFSPAWAPDSQRIVFCEMEWLKAKPDVRLIIYDTVSKRQQIRHLPRGLQGACWMGNDAILFSAIEDKSGKYDIYRYHIVSDKIINLTNTPQIQEYKPHWIDDRALDVSPPEKKTTQWGKVKAQ